MKILAQWHIGSMLLKSIHHYGFVAMKVFETERGLFVEGNMGTTQGQVYDIVKLDKFSEFDVNRVLKKVREDA